MYEETMGNLTITNDILPLSSSEETRILLPWLKALAFAILKRQPFLNVSRRNGALYTFLLFVKNAIACYGVSYILPKSVTILVLILLYESSMLSPVRSDQLGLALLSFYLTLGFKRLTAPLRLLILFQSLGALPIFNPTHYSTEYYVDFFCAVTLTWYILDGLLEQFRIHLEKFLSVMIAYSILLLMDVTMLTGGYLFEMVLIFHMFFYLCCTLDEYTLGNMAFDIPLIVIFLFFALKKSFKLNVNTLFQNWEDMLTAENMILFGD